jgi:hypothetical protein
MWPDFYSCRLIRDQSEKYLFGRKSRLATWLL